MRIIGILLLVAGLAGLAVFTFQYTRDKDVLKVGPIEVQAKEKETVTIPPHSPRAEWRCPAWSWSWPDGRSRWYPAAGRWAAEHSHRGRAAWGVSSRAS